MKKTYSVTLDEEVVEKTIKKAKLKREGKRIYGFSTLINKLLEKFNG